MDLTNKKILIIGAGRTGLAAARFCIQHGAQVVLNDAQDETKLGSTLDAFKQLGVELRVGHHDPMYFDDCAGAVVSPGVPTQLPLLQHFKTSGRFVMGELELAFRYAKAPIIAVTGTNGKSTTVTLIHHMLQTSQMNSKLGGNIGTPFLELVSSEDPVDVYVLEVSSYQLETIEQFHPHIAVLLNITPDHLSRHPNPSAYTAAKARIFSKQESSDWAIYNADDPQVELAVSSTRARRLPWSLRRAISPGLFRQHDQVVWFHEGHQEVYDLSQYHLKGDHQIENAMAAIAAARLAGAELHYVQEALDTFRGLPHRFEAITTLRGIHFINDSKATNVGAAVKAVEGSPSQRLILLAGGTDKGSSYEPLKDALIRQQAKAVCVYGEAAGALQEVLGTAIPTFRHSTLEEAFSEALSRAQAGDWIVLAPACASFDQFKHFEHRGEVFRQLVWQQDPSHLEAYA